VRRRIDEESGAAGGVLVPPGAGRGGAVPGLAPLRFPVRRRRILATVGLHLQDGWQCWPSSVSPPAIKKTTGRYYLFTTTTACGLRAAGEIGPSVEKASGFYYGGAAPPRLNLDFLFPRVSNIAS